MPSGDDICFMTKGCNEAIPQREEQTNGTKPADSFGWNWDTGLRELLLASVSRKAAKSPERESGRDREPETSAGGRSGGC